VCSSDLLSCRNRPEPAVAVPAEPVADRARVERSDHRPQVLPEPGARRDGPQRFEDEQARRYPQYAGSVDTARIPQRSQPFGLHLEDVRVADSDRLGEDPGPVVEDDSASQRDDPARLRR